MSIENNFNKPGDIVPVTEEEIEEEGAYMSPLEREKARVTWEVLRQRLGRTLDAAKEVGITPTEFLNAGFRGESKQIGRRGADSFTYGKCFDVDNLKGHGVRVSWEEEAQIVNGKVQNVTLKNLSVRVEPGGLDKGGKPFDLSDEDAQRFVRKYGRLMDGYLDDESEGRFKIKDGRQFADYQERVLHFAEHRQQSVKDDPSVRALGDLLK